MANKGMLDPQSGRRMILLAPLTISAAVAATATTPILGLHNMNYLTAEAVFLYGAGGTTANAYVQTSYDGGLSWFDVINFSFTTSAGTKVSSVTSFIAPASQGFTPGDGALASNTIIQGSLGDRIRLKYVTTGTYSGATSLAVYAIAKS